MLCGENEIQIMSVDQSLSKSSQVLLNWLDKVPFIIKTEPMAKLKKVETSLNITDNLTSRAFELNLNPGRQNRVCDQKCRNVVWN